MIILFALSLLALVAVLRARSPRVAFVPVPARHALGQGRTLHRFHRPGVNVSTVDLAAVGRELRFRQVTSRN